MKKPNPPIDPRLDEFLKMLLNLNKVVHESIAMQNKRNAEQDRKDAERDKREAERDKKDAERDKKIEQILRDQQKIKADQQHIKENQKEIKTILKDHGQRISALEVNVSQINKRIGVLESYHQNPQDK
ncbi:hypothetical protein ACW95P_00025 [Candidatus Mycoplasma pogonae]